MVRSLARILLLSSCVLAGATLAFAARERLSLDAGWRFHLGDIAAPVPRTHDETYHSTKAGKGPGAAAVDFDDSAWREVAVPHDWVSEAPFVETANVSQGYRPRGVAWYRRQFALGEAERGRHFELQFDGVATHCTVWINGILAHRSWSGYTPFAIDFTSFARFGAELNTVGVRVDAEPMEGWWYEGGGIYRHAWLVKRDALHLVTDGVYANPVREADGRWRVPVEATLANFGLGPKRASVEAVLSDAEGREVARARVDAGTLALLTEKTVALALAVAEPRLWSVDDPALYTVRTSVRRGNDEVDAVTTTCGFRTLRFDAARGFFLNDQPLKIKGVSNHQDHAGVGVAVPDALWEFRLKKLKEMGANAYRCSHHPPVAEFLDACDRLGILVMNENRIFNPTPEYRRQLETMVRRDRNHPSVMLWSVFNEEPMQATESGREMVRVLAATVKRLDTTRPVTAAMSAGFFAPHNVSQVIDVMGFNYSQGDYDRFHAENPTLPLISSEDTSTFMTRGEWATDPARRVISSYDTDAAAWGATHRESWRAVADRPFVAGTFVWTGFDYHGEPTPHAWPTVGSFFGCLDLCGFPKAAFFIRQAQWLERPVLHLAPHWNWAGREGHPIKVVAFANVEKVALTLNGAALGERVVDRFNCAAWEVPYAPGRLEAVGYRDGREVARAVVETTGAAVALRLTADRTALAGDGADALPVTVEAIDALGRVVPGAAPRVEFETVGPIAIIGVGNGDPNSHEAEKGSARTLFHGLAQVIVQTVRDGCGAAQLRARATGCRGTEIAFDVRAAERAAVTAR